MKSLLSDWPEGIKRTKQREELLQILNQATAPLSAIEIFNLMKEKGSKPSFSTVYRTLDLFVKEEIAIRHQLSNQEMALFERHHQKHKHYAVCTQCHKMIEMSQCPLDAVMPQLEDGAFQITSHHLEIYGICKNCSMKK